jgi:hypothetical protein
MTMLLFLLLSFNLNASDCFYGASNITMDDAEQAIKNDDLSDDCLKIIQDKFKVENYATYLERKRATLIQEDVKDLLSKPVTNQLIVNQPEVNQPLHKTLWFKIIVVLMSIVFLGFIILLFITPPPNW